MEKYYKPNIGPLFWAHLILILAVLMPVLIILKILGIATATLLIPVLLILLLVVIISLLVVAKTSYVVDDEKITIASAFKKIEIPCDTVTKIVDTNKGFAGEGALVLSSDRIVIFFGENSKASMSPMEKPDALSTLRACCPEAEFEEDLKVKASKETAETAGEETVDIENEETGEIVSDDASETEIEETADAESEETAEAVSEDADEAVPEESNEDENE